MNLIWPLLFFVGFVQGTFLSVVLFLRGKSSLVSFRFLSIMTFCFSLMILEEFTEVAGLREEAGKFSGSTFLFDLALGPLIYLHATTLLNNTTRFKTSFLWHFVPFMLCSAVYFLYHFLYPVNPLFIPENELILVLIVNLKLLFLEVYFYITIKKIGTALSTGNSATTNKFYTGWLKKLLIISMINIAIIMLLFNFREQALAYFIDSDHYTTLFLALTIFAIVFFALKYSPFFGNIRKMDFYADKIETDIVKYKTSSLSPGQKKDFTGKLLTYMTDKKPYLNKKLRLPDLATALQMNTNELSQILNEVLEMNFYQFINNYRVQEVMIRMRNSENDNKTLLGIALESGFSNKATFIRAFKLVTGSSPSDYKQKIGNNR